MGELVIKTEFKQFKRKVIKNVSIIDIECNDKYLLLEFEDGSCMKCDLCTDNNIKYNDTTPIINFDKLLLGALL